MLLFRAKREGEFGAILRVHMRRVKWSGMNHFIQAMIRILGSENGVPTLNRDFLRCALLRDFLFNLTPMLSKRELK